MINHILSVSKDQLISFSYLRELQTENKYNLRNKWTSVCFALDYENDQLDLFINGEGNIAKIKNHIEFGNVTHAKKNKKMTIRLGLYDFDDTPLIGKIIDFHLWDRLLTKEELSQYSDCQKYMEKVGTLVNSTTEFTVSSQSFVCDTHPPFLICSRSLVH